MHEILERFSIILKSKGYTVHEEYDGVNGSGQIIWIHEIEKKSGVVPFSYFEKYMKSDFDIDKMDYEGIINKFTQQF